MLHLVPRLRGGIEIYNQTLTGKVITLGRTLWRYTGLSFTGKQHHNTDAVTLKHMTADCTHAMQHFCICVHDRVEHRVEL
eukprot:2607-Heterococcus_DN1.PRE.1